ncbi:MAG: MFS transporter, partial [Chloroflexota bacterium]|nr:MFS transporter [Chloroflexota bacterium]
APLVALLAANAVSLVGNTLTAVALPWYVLQTTGSATRTGLVAAVAVLPAFVAGILGGTLIDRVGYKRISVLADVVSGLAIAAVPLLYQTVGLAFWQLLALVFLGALLDIPGLTARRSLLPELAARAGWRLERANSAFESSQFLSLLLGPPLAGLLIAAVGASNVLWLDAATFAVSALLVVALVPAALPAERSTEGEGYFAELAAGFRFIHRDRLLLILALALMASNVLSGPLFAVLLPVYVEETFGRAEPLGLALAAIGLSSLAGSLLFGAVGHRVRRRPLWLAAFLLAPVELWILATDPSVPVLVAALALAGVVMGPVNPLLVTIRHERIPPDLRGRVFGTFSAVAVGAQPLGLLLAGFLIDGVGFRPTVLLLAGAAQLLGVLLLFAPTLREMDVARTARAAR